jgi:mannosyltransferase OCH1-like enzyme
MKIPKIIHQTWIFKNDDHIKSLRDIWLGHNPDYEYFIYDDEDNLKFIKENFNERIYNCYSRILNGSAKADFFRYAVLYIKGGVYLDIDFLPKASLSDCIEENDELIITHDDQVSRRDVYKNGVFNAFICAKPKHELLIILINQICEYIENGEHNNVRGAIHSLTGSKLLRKKFRNYFKTQNIKECKTDSYKIVTHNAFTTTPLDKTITCGDKILFTSQNKIPNRSLSPHYGSNFELYK